MSFASNLSGSVGTFSLHMSLFDEPIVQEPDDISEITDCTYTQVPRNRAVHLLPQRQTNVFSTPLYAERAPAAPAAPEVIDLTGEDSEEEYPPIEQVFGQLITQMDQDNGWSDDEDVIYLEHRLPASDLTDATTLADSSTMSPIIEWRAGNADVIDLTGDE